MEQSLPKDWRELRVPVAWAVVAVLAALSFYGWLHVEFALAEDVRKKFEGIELQAIERERRDVELEVIKLQVKQETYPGRFDAIDKAVLEKQEKRQGELEQRIKALRVK